MEYEKQLNRLVLGYLKTECKKSYKVFLKYNFPNQYKHIPTRVAGQTLEDILRVYSRIQEIVQGRLEDTDYYKERTAEYSSPIHLIDQLLYLLDKDAPFTPASTPCPRSPGESSIAETYHEKEVCSTRISDVETTPEHTLPGNVSSNDGNYLAKTPYKRKSGSPYFKTPCMEKLPPADKETISEVMTLKLLERRDFHEKIAQNINSALNTPEMPSSVQRGENNKSKDGIGAELEDTIIKNAVKRTEADPMFEDLLQEFLGTPVVDRIGKAICAEVTNTTSSGSAVSHTTTPSKNWNIDDHNNRAVSSILSAVTGSNSEYATDDDAANNKNVNNLQEPIISPATDVESTTTNVINNQCLLPTTGGMYVVPQSTTTTMSSGNQQQFYIVNQPVVLPQTSQMMQLIQPVQSAFQPVVIQSKPNTHNITKNNTHLTDREIMAMPTIILNERNEITYADGNGYPTNSPAKINEARTIKEYINLYGSCDQSPIVTPKPIKNYSTKVRVPIKPTPTIKVEIYKGDIPIPNPSNIVSTPGISTDTDQSLINQNITKNVDSEKLPNLDTTIRNSEATTTDKSTNDITKERSFEGNSSKTNSVSDSSNKINSKVLSTVCTPSPIHTVVRKPTPKSGSHVRNLTFPSPLRKTSEKSETKRSSPRIANKQQATKDLFRITEEEEKSSNVKEEEVNQTNKSSKQLPNVEEKSTKHSKKETTKSRKKSPEKNAKAVENNTKHSKKESKKSPKKSPKKNATSKTFKKGTKEEGSKTRKNVILSKDSWDSNLRKMIPAIMDENNSTPPRKTSTRKRIKQSTKLDTTDHDGRTLEEALRTPEKSEKPKRKTPIRKNPMKTTNSQKLEESLKPHNIEVKGETKILSPSKLNANKRNILPIDIDDFTPDNHKEPLHYPVTSKTQRNINALLETPVKEDFVPPTPGTVPQKPDTPFTPMLKANLKDFTGGDIFSIDTPNFPSTPGLSVILSTSTTYYMLNDNESNKVTEEIVRKEEKKSSVRKSDDEEVELSPRVYGAKEILDNFNKCRVGRKNLELLDKRGVTWDGSSSKDDKSEETSENNSEDESNNTVIQNQKVEQSKQNNDLLKTSLLQDQLLKTDADHSESPDKTLEISNQEVKKTHVQQNEEDKGGGSSSKKGLDVNKLFISGSSDSDSEVLSKTSYEQKNHNKIVSHIDSKSTFVPENKNTMEYIDSNMQSKRERTSKTEDTLGINTEENIRRTISNVCLENTLDLKSPSTSIKAQLEEKKKRVMELEKTPQSTCRKTPSRRAAMRPQPNLNLSRNKRKSSSPKRMVHSVKQILKDKEMVPENELSKNSELTKKESETSKEKLKSDTVTEDRAVDSQDEFFKKSGTNLHRKNKRILQKTEKEPESAMMGSIKDENNTHLMADKIWNEIKTIGPQKENELVCDQSENKHEKEPAPVVDKNDQSTISLQADQALNLSAGSDNPDEFEKSWNICDFRQFDSEQEIFCTYEESTTISKKRMEDYDLKILQKKVELEVPCSDGSNVDIVLAVSPFVNLLDLKPAKLDCNKDEIDSSLESLKRVSNATSDSENAECKSDGPDDLKCTKKRKHRSDSCNSDSSNKKMKRQDTQVKIPQVVIDKVLNKLHGSPK